jgi:hypothetical protein
MDLVTPVHLQPRKDVWRQLVGCQRVDGFRHWLSEGNIAFRLKGRSRYLALAVLQQLNPELQPTYVFWLDSIFIQVCGIECELQACV